MDKKQKELIKTYFKYRNQAFENITGGDFNCEYYGHYNNYEINNYTLQNKLINPLFYTPKEKAKYFNEKLNTDKFKNIYCFEYANGNIALAELNDGSYKFIDKNGKFSIENINPFEVEDEKMRTAYFNQKYGKNIFVFVEKFNYANGKIALAFRSDNKYMFIDKNGKPSIKGINLNNIYGDIDRAAYFNVKTKKYVYEYVSEFKWGKNNHAVASIGNDDNNKFVFINKNGDINCDNIDLNDLCYSFARAIYFNCKLNINVFKEISEFKYDNGKLALAKLKDGTEKYINKEGKFVNYSE